MQILERLKAHLKEHPELAMDAAGEPVDLEVQAAVAVLLLEAAYGDEQYVWREQRAIRKGLEGAFGLGRREILSLLDRAEEIRPPVVALKDVTDLIAERFTEAQREELLTVLWKVVHADGIVDSTLR